MTNSVQSNITAFLTELAAVAPPAGQGAYAFMTDQGVCRGWVQFIHRSDEELQIHRLWTLQPGGGNGSIMLNTLCRLADCHGIQLHLKPLPFGRKPHPVSRDQLAAWYGRYGFEGTRRRMIRPPKVARSDSFIPATQLKE